MICFGYTIFQYKKIIHLKSVLKSVYNKSIIRYQNKMENIYLPIPAEMKILNDSIYKNKLVYFYKNNSCSACDDFFDHIVNIQDTLIRKSIIILTNNLNDRELNIIRAQVGEDIKVNGLSSFDFFIQEPFICYIDSDNQIVLEYVPSPYIKEIVNEYLKRIKEKFQ